MRLKKIQEYLKSRGWKYKYFEEDGCGSIEFSYRGIPYHVWEYEEDGWGADSNVREGGRQENFTGDYEREIIRVMENWK